jgi:hypothetical protein
MPKEWVGGLTTKERAERSAWLEKQGKRAKSVETEKPAPIYARPGQVTETSPGKFLLPRTSDIYLPSPAPPMGGIGPSWGPEVLRQVIMESMANRPLYSEKEVSPELVRNRDYWRRQERKK